MLGYYLIKVGCTEDTAGADDTSVASEDQLPESLPRHLQIKLS